MILLMIRQIAAFTRNTLLETLRNKLLYALLFFGVAVIGATSAFGALSLHQDERVFNNLVLFANVLFLAALAIYQGVGSIQREIETRTIYTVLSKPVMRGTFLVGKFTASLTMITLCLGILFAMTLAMAAFLDYAITPQLFAAYYGLFLQLAIITAAAIFFSSFSTTLLSALFTFSVFLVGNLTPQLREAAAAFAKTGNPTRHIVDAVLWIIPDLEKLNLSFELTHKLTIPTSYLLTATGYTAVYVAFLLGGAYIVFRNRDFY